MFHLASGLSFLVVLIGYLGLSLYLQRAYYRASLSGAKEVGHWKIQPTQVDSVHLSDRCWLPAAAMLGHHKPGRSEKHALFASINLFVACAWAAVATELACRGTSPLKPNATMLESVSSFLLLTLYEMFAEYYHHRLFHLPFMYRHFHRFHHQNRSPAPFDDMHAAPAEVFVYYCILWGPAVFWPRGSVPVGGFLAYMVFMGVTGILDHSGVRVRVEGVYDSADHDRHHSKPNVNYGFPHPLVDILHGTFEGNYLGVTFRPK